MAHIAPHILLQIKSASFKGIQSKRNLQAFEKEIGEPKDPKRAAKAGASRQREEDREKVSVESRESAPSSVSTAAVDYSLDVTFIYCE